MGGKKTLLGTDMKDNLLFKYREQMSALNCFWMLAGKSLINKGREFHHVGIYMEAISISKGKPQVLNTVAMCFCLTTEGTK